MNLKLNIQKSWFNEIYFPYLFDYKYKNNVYYGGSGSGKSFFVFSKLLIKALKTKRRVLVVRKVAATNKESTWKQTLDLLSMWKIKDYCKINNSDFSLELPNGSTFLFKGLDDPEKVKSIVGITDCICEEASELSEDDFDQLQLRVRADVEDLQFYILFNPVSKANWVYKRWFAPDVEIKEDTFILKTTYKDNLRHLPTDYVKTLENMISTNPTYYKIYALGEFSSLDKLIFSNWEEKEFDYKILKGELIAGLDWGFSNDDTAFVVSVLNEDEKTIHVFKEWRTKGKTNEEIARAITNLGHAKTIIIADSAEPKSIEELKRNGLYRIRESVKGKDSIIHGIQKLQQYKIYVHPSCTDLITEFENYSWKKDKKTNEYLNEPIDAFNHSIDALRYSIQAVGKAHLKSFDKSLLGL